MCGITGFIGYRHTKNSLTSIVASMTEAIAHRGPDDSGVWVSEADGVGLGHRRLAILELSELGRQPMQSPDGRGVVVFNGEIYNHHVLRHDLLRKGVVFRGRSDTETLLYALLTYGIEVTLRRIEGMFAFAFYDTRTRKLVLARDRFGEKPLHYAVIDGNLIFASELKAMRRYRDWSPTIRMASVSEVIRYQHIAEPNTIYENVFKLEASHYLECDVTKWKSGDHRLTKRSYWSLQRQETDEPVNESAIIEDLHRRLDCAVNARMEADVPLGVFLSGGIDSSLITALMAKHSTRAVQSFTVAFADGDYDESRFALAIAKHLGTDHHELHVETRDVIDIVPTLATVYDEPFSDTSQIPLLFISRFARNKVTVALSGDGGDELFGGYNRYVWLPRLYAQLSKVPMPTRQLLAFTAKYLGVNRVAAIYRAFSAFRSTTENERQLADKLEKLIAILSSRSASAMFDDVRGVQIPKNLFADEVNIAVDGGRDVPVEDFERYMMHSDIRGYLPNDILVKVDRATMATSLEARAPFLDSELAQFAWNMPMTLKIRDGKGKWALREILSQYIPRELFERKKAGFAVPIGNWIYGPLRAWAQDLLQEETIRKQGIFNPDVVNTLWREHATGKRNHQNTLWSLLVFQQWLDAQNSFTHIDD